MRRDSFLRRTIWTPPGPRSSSSRLPVRRKKTGRWTGIWPWRGTGATRTADFVRRRSRGTGGAGTGPPGRLSGFRRSAPARHRGADETFLPHPRRGHRRVASGGGDGQTGGDDPELHRPGQSLSVSASGLGGHASERPGRFQHRDRRGHRGMHPGFQRTGRFGLNLMSIFFNCNRLQGAQLPNKHPKENSMRAGCFTANGWLMCSW